MIENDTKQKAEQVRTQTDRARTTSTGGTADPTCRQTTQDTRTSGSTWAVDEFHRLPKSHLARRRQLQFIGKLMRDINQPAIERQLQALEAPAPSQPKLPRRKSGHSTFWKQTHPSLNPSCTWPLPLIAKNSGNCSAKPAKPRRIPNRTKYGGNCILISQSICEPVYHWSCWPDP